MSKFGEDGLFHQLEPLVQAKLEIEKGAISRLPDKEKTQQLNGFTLLSIAISAKRIADTLDALRPMIEDMYKR